jgi:hypothetical protein
MLPDRVALAACESVGIVVYRLNTPGRGDAIIELCRDADGLRAQSAGIATAALLEGELRRRGVRRVYARRPQSTASRCTSGSARLPAAAARRLAVRTRGCRVVSA